jgi:hypothetical protein
MGRNDIYFGRSSPTFRQNVLTLTAWSKGKPNKRSARRRRQLLVQSDVLIASDRPSRLDTISIRLFRISLRSRYLMYTRRVLFNLFSTWAQKQIHFKNSEEALSKWFNGPWPQFHVTQQPSTRAEKCSTVVRSFQLQKSNPANASGNIVVMEMWLLLLLLLLFCSPLLGLGCFFSFLMLYTIGWAPQTGDQPVARPLPTRRHIQTQN